MLNPTHHETSAGFRLHRLELLNWGTFDRQIWCMQIFIETERDFLCLLGKQREVERLWKLNNSFGKRRHRLETLWLIAETGSKPV